MSPIGGVAAAGAAANTVVSLTFDDGYASQYQTRAMLSAHGMRGTFYINSGTRPPGYNTLSWAQLHDLANDGNEIGGHTVDHADLTAVSTSKATAEICNDRTALQAQGFTVTSFAYPYGHNNSTLWNIVKNCGYSSARDVSGIVSPEGCSGCPYAETIPPANAYDTHTPENVNQNMALSEIEGFVTQAENHGGGWVQLAFHDICNPGRNCDQYSITPAHFSTLLDWIAARPSSTVVRTVGEVISGTSSADSTPPVTTITCNGASCGGGYYAARVQVSLGATDAGSGVSVIRYTTNGSRPTQSGSGGTTYTAPFSLSASTNVRFRAWDNAGNAEATKSTLVTVDSDIPVSSIACNGTACSGGWYGAPVQVSLSATDQGGSGVAAVRYTVDGSDPTFSSPVYSAPLTISGPTNLKYRAFDNAANPEPTNDRFLMVDTDGPVSSANCGAALCTTSWTHGPVRVALSAADTGGSGVASLRYTTDGSTPTITSPEYTASFVVYATAMVTFRAVDNAGNAGPVNSVLVRIDLVPPILTISSPANHAPVSGSVKFAAITKDALSGVAKVNFYVNGRLVSTDASAPYSFAWNTDDVTNTTHTLTAKAVDRAGNSTSRSISVKVA